ncbi:polysaccharide deacetylase family protein [Actinomycetes bacterium NPDC127524]
MKMKIKPRKWVKASILAAGVIGIFGAANYETYDNGAIASENKKTDAAKREFINDHIVKKEKLPAALYPIISSASQQVRLKPSIEDYGGSKTIYLTFDDGPDQHSMKLLKILDQYHAKATFFLLEPNIKKHQNIVREMQKRGHSLGLHGVSHNAHLIYRSKETVVAEMKQDQKTLRAVTGVTTHLIRTPYGSSPYMKPAYMKAVQQNGFKLWDWSIDSEDWQCRNGQYVSNVEKQLKQHNFKTIPNVILMHEKPSTYQYLPKLLNYLQKNGYKFESIKDDMVPYHFKAKVPGKS